MLSESLNHTIFNTNDILGLNMYEQELGLLPWLSEPMTIEEVEGEESRQFRAYWPEVTLTGEGLVEYLNAVAPNRDGKIGILGDFSLQLTKGGVHDKELYERHAKSFARAWDVHHGYAQRAQEAIQDKEVLTTIEHQGKTMQWIGQVICSRDYDLANFNPYTKEYYQDPIKRPFDLPLPDLLDKYGVDWTDYYEVGVPRGVEEIVQRVDPEYLPHGWRMSRDVNGDRGLVAPVVVSALLKEYPEAIYDLYELATKGARTVEFEVNGRTMLSKGSGYSPEELQEMFTNGKGVHTYKDDQNEFQYIIDKSGSFIVKVLDTITEVDTIPRLRPVLTWKRLDNDSRVIDYDADTSERDAEKGSTRFTIIDDPTLGATIPFLLSPGFRADPKLWPARESLPDDKTTGRQRRFGSGQPENGIGPATVVLQAMRRRTQIAKVFPFDRFEEAASSVN